MKIRKCPFCGHGGEDDALPTKIEDREYGEPDQWAVRCEWCAARGPTASSHLLSIAEWNKRGGDNANNRKR